MQRYTALCALSALLLALNTSSASPVPRILEEVAGDFASGELASGESASGDNEAGSGFWPPSASPY